jgi:hypothetical protein
MAKNRSREFATMTDEERSRFALEQGGGTAGGDATAEEAADELELNEPRDPDKMGRHYANPADEVADPEARDGAAAVLDGDRHRRDAPRRNAPDAE